MNNTFLKNYTEIFPISPNISVYGLKNDDDSDLFSFCGYLLSPHDKFIWSSTMKEATESELKKEIDSMQRPYLPGVIQPLIRQLCGQKSKKKPTIVEKEEHVIEEKEKNDYSDDDEDEDDDEEDEENDEDEVIDEDVLEDEDIDDEEEEEE